MTPDFAVILERRFSGRIWSINADDYDQLVMLDGGPKPTKKELEDLWPQVETEITAEAENQTNTRASARAKLKALGLTEDEIAALVG